MSKVQTLAIKENEEIKMDKKVIYSIYEDYLTKEDGFLSNVIDSEKFKKLKPSKIDDVRKVVNSSLPCNNIAAKKNFDEFLNTMYNKISQIKTMEDIDEVLNYYISLSNSQEKNLRKALQSNKDLLASILIKRMVVLYYQKKIAFKESEEYKYIKSFGKVVLSQNDVDIIVDKIYSETPSTSNPDFNTFCKKIISDVVNTVDYDLHKHLCWEGCSCAYADKCPKIQDSFKNKNIEKYPFIEEGWQSFDENGNLDRLVVTKCSNYIYEQQKSTVLSKDVKQARDNLRMLYFDARTVEEANRNQASELIKGRLINPRGKIPKKEMEQLRKEEQLRKDRELREQELERLKEERKIILHHGQDELFKIINELENKGKQKKLK